MVDVIKYQTMERFLGINNVDDPTRLIPLVVNHEYVHPLQQASNVEIDNTYGLSSRSGYGTAGTSGTDFHSLWSDGTTCLYVDGTTFWKFHTDYARTSIRTGLTRGARMSYAPFNDRIYHTNGYEIGYILNSASILLSDPALEFKLPLPAGQLIEYYRGCLYVARDNVLYISDSLCDYFDIRHGYKQFAFRITLLRAIDKGIYVGDTKIWWLEGGSADDFERIEPYPHPAIPFTDIRVNGQYIGEGIKGNVAIWTGDNGICVGDNSGQVVNLTSNRYTFTPTPKGTGFIRENNNVRHYINSLY